ncbi:hypothetical protein [Synechococcus lacustris]|uniref:hypothetical protein n=1 Tax=Synechococcus lacustris TaxID=2116544 RepID=UPI00333F3F4A
MDQPAPPQPIAANLQPLLRELKAHGFKVRFEQPPKIGVYGLFEARSRTLWVHPITFELGISRQTLLHEAVHADQSCPQGNLTRLGIAAPVSPLIAQEINSILFSNYHVKDRVLEQEAFSLQGQTTAPSILVKLLRQRCKT